MDKRHLRRQSFYGQLPPLGRWEQSKAVSPRKLPPIRRRSGSPPYPALPIDHTQYRRRLTNRRRRTTTPPPHHSPIFGPSPKHVTRALKPLPLRQVRKKLWDKTPSS